jgi:NAD(P)-dependent dehydrogenase (short-subunit alcohol dehydrogenase family)
MTGRVAEKVAIVTGGARGMGRSHCLALAREGAKVAVIDIAKNTPDSGYKMGGEDELNGVVKDIKAAGGQGIAVHCDVTNSDSIRQMTEAVIKEFGRIDILVNNVGVVRLETNLTEMTEDVWDFMIDVNLKSQFLCCKYVAPYMIKQSYGKIINIGSTSGRLESATTNAYGVAKAGVHAFTRVLAGELAPHKINVNCIAPGSIKDTGTKIIANAVFARRYGVPESEAYQAHVKKMHLLQREILPEDVSNAVVFLASDESRNIDGMVIYVDGGHPS